MERMSLSKETEIAIDFLHGELAEISQGGRQINEGRVPLFAVKLRDRAGVSRIINARACKLVSYENNRAVYTCAEFDFTLIFRQEKDGLCWRANVKNKTSELLEWVEAMSFSVEGKLKDEKGGKGAIVYPYNEGCLVTDMAYRESMPFHYIEPDYPSKNTFSIFPNMVFAQFIAYIVDSEGIYLGMHDEARTTKHIDFCYDQGYIRIFMRAFCDVDYGEDYEMPFDGVMSIFQGEWYGAVELYRKWFETHLPVGLKKIDDNPALPAWYGESPLIVAYPLRGTCDVEMTENGLYPYANAYPFLEEIAKETDGKVMALLMHWEGTAPWAPPYVWPPYGGEAEFSAFADGLHQRDMLIGLYCSGLGWTQQSNIDKNYCCEKDFEGLKLSECVCTDTNGETRSTICLAQRSGYDFCPACDTTKKIFKEELEKACGGNVDYLQALDQNHGGASYFCYSDKHGHPPAPGKWQQEEMNKLLSSIDRKGVLLGCESAAAEPFLPQLQLSDNRFELNYYVGTPIPIYSYLYHEYVNNFMGNQICAMLEKRENNFTYRLAYSFIAGDMSTVVMDGKGDLLYAWCDYVKPLDWRVDKAVALGFIKTLNGWRRNGGKNFLHKGKMIVPNGIFCQQEKFLLEDEKTYLVTDSVLTAQYEYRGERAQFLVNYNLQPISVDLDGEYDVYFDSELTCCEKGLTKLTIAPLSVVMLKTAKV